MENVNHQPPPPQPTIQNNSEKPSSKYKILGIIIIIFGFLQVPIPALQILFVIPQITNLYEGLNIEQPSLIPAYAVLTFLIILGLINIFIGIKLILKSTLHKEIYFKLGIATLIIIFLSVGSSIAFTITSVITPIYKLTSELDSSPSPTIFQTPSPTPTINASDTSTPANGAGWKTYTNEKYGFSFKYPDNFIFNNCSATDYISIAFDQADLVSDGSVYCAESTFPEGSYAIYLEIVSKDIKNINEAIKKIPLGHNDQLSNAEKIIVYNEFTKIKRTSNDNSYQVFYFVQHPKNTLILQFYLVHPKRMLKSKLIDYEKILDQILSTFKFINP
ncbi:MAG: PsbP-related protein [Candidatus Levybacteria bacterium]|nr:PsbP-related protein [Candidatus Levybacteria bacterium]